MRKLNYSLLDISMAYRKVKADLFLSGYPCKGKLADFENNLDENFDNILNALNSYDTDTIFPWCKGYLLCPKKVETDAPQDNIVLSKPVSNKKTKCELRVIADTPIEFHIITTLWINKVGEKFEKSLSVNSHGNRIRRHKDGTPNLYAIGTFNYYLNSYQNWRDNGLRVMRDNIEKRKKVIAITADFTGFYHNINPYFLLDLNFLNELNKTTLNQNDKDFTSLIIEMISKWNKVTPLKNGLPVGVSISAVIANLALLYLDKCIERELAPLYYGRYVDDMIIVFENSNDFSSSSDIWNWVTKRVDCLTSEPADDLTSENEKISFDQKYLKDKKIESELYFEKNKTKIFVLEYPTGLALIDSLEYQIKKNASEWRLLPDLPQDSQIASMLLSTSNRSGEDADNLRKADNLSVKRAQFAMKLRDFESYCRNLEANSWTKQRRAFLTTIEQHFTNIQNFFDLHKYFPRIISIATECEDYESIIAILIKIDKIFEEMQSIEELTIVPARRPNKNTANTHGHRLNLIQRLKKYIYENIKESIIAAIPKQLPKETIDSLKKYFDVGDNPLEQRKIWMECDLAYKPFRTLFFPKIMHWSREDDAFEIKNILTTENRGYLFKNGFHVLKKLSKYTKRQNIDCVPTAWIFPTRPFNMMELYFIIHDPFSKTKDISKILSVLRGYSNNDAAMPKKDNDNKYIDIPITRANKESLLIAVTSWKTEEESWISSVCNKCDPDQDRFKRLMHLLNHILKTHKKLDYVVFPELSIPPRWFTGIARKLKTSGISLISGVEYIHPPKDNSSVCNQVWCSLLHDKLGFRESVVLKHDKAIPAIHEAHDLAIHNGKKLKAENENSTNNIIKHGDFFFGILIFNELTNIDYRANFRGKVDAIFIPEWNKDTEMFSSLVEAVAYDIHAYIIQCNNREHGDTRIRVPAKDHFNRDIVKIKGGEEDYFVIGKINIEKLRSFQSHTSHPLGENILFKPVPCGYKISDERKTLPD